MSKQKKAKEEATPLKGTDGALVVGAITLSGVVKTAKGFALATARFNEAGELLELKINSSQAHKEFVALEFKRFILASVAKV